MNTELTIIIPAKNEVANIRKLLKSIAKQDYLKTHRVPIILADAESEDGTRLEASLTALEYELNLMVIPGGLPAKGRNAGAKLATSRYLLFLDADVELEDPELIGNAITAMRLKYLNCVTTDIHSPDDRQSQLAMGFVNICQRCSRFLGIPFATGMFMLFERAMFMHLGGFREDALFAEDYMLSKRVGWNRFRVISGGIRTSNRRIKKMGLWRLTKLFFTILFQSHRETAFKADRGYWSPY
jgi:glycosyltransferase involved in cell wall biosynthesis